MASGKLFIKKGLFRDNMNKILLLLSLLMAQEGYLNNKTLNEIEDFLKLLIFIILEIYVMLFFIITFLILKLEQIINIC